MRRSRDTEIQNIERKIRSSRLKIKNIKNSVGNGEYSTQQLAYLSLIEKQLERDVALLDRMKSRLNNKSGGYL